MAEANYPSSDRTIEERFGYLLNWLNGQCDGGLVERSKTISPETFRRWLRKGPPTTATPQLGALERWARQNIKSYPPRWEPGGLTGLQFQASRDRRTSGEKRHEAHPRKLSEEPPTLMQRVDVPVNELTTDAASSIPAQLSRPPITFPGPSRRRRWRAAMAVGAALVVGGTATLVTAKALHRPADTRVVDAHGAPVVLRSCAEKTCTGPTIASGSRVAMICWEDAENATFSYRSNRWFWVVSIDDPSATGWAHSSQVIAQVRVGHC